MAFMQLADRHKVPDLTFNNVTVPSRLMDHIIRGRTTNVTVFEAVAAVLWQCRTRAVMTNPEAPAVLLFAVNARKYLGAKDGYYGNCSTMHVAVAKSGAVANADINDIVDIIRRAKERIPEQLKMTGGSDMTMLRELADDHRLDGYESLLYLTSWRNIGFEDVDFGSGKTARVMTYPQREVFSKKMPICFMLKNTPQGARVISGCVKAHHADAFHQEIAKLNATT
ncbi:Os10g0109200 [Oryza sativa Japonica Group]|nr:Os10g0109200 [Oryza sativa Japonica Group]